MADPNAVFSELRFALREQQVAQGARRVEEEALADYRRLRADETAREVARREVLIEAAKARAAAASTRLMSARAALEGLVRGVEDGSITLPEPTAHDADSDALRTELARQEAAAVPLVQELDEAATRLQNAITRS